MIIQTTISKQGGQIMTQYASRLCMMFCIIMFCSAFPLWAIDQQCIDDCTEAFNLCVETYALQCVQITCNIELMYCNQWAQSQFEGCYQQCLMNQGNEGYCGTVCYAETYAVCYSEYQSCYQGCFGIGAIGCSPAYSTCLQSCQN
jgi:hypothetical protein